MFTMKTVPTRPLTRANPGTGSSQNTQNIQGNRKIDTMMKSPNDPLDKILKKLDNLSSEIQELKKQNKELNSMVTELKDLKNYMEVKEEKWKQERDHLLERIHNLEIAENQCQKSEKRDNIIIKGLKLTTSDSKVEVREFLQEKLNVACEISEVLRIEPIYGDPFLKVKLNSFVDKVEIMKNRKSLGQEKIYIDNDLTKEELKIQKEIVLRAKQEKDKSKMVKIGYRKLIINDEVWKWVDGQGLKKNFREKENAGSQRQQHSNKGHEVFPEQGTSSGRKSHDLLNTGKGKRNQPHHVGTQ